MEPVIISHGGVGAQADWSDGCEAANAAAHAALAEGDVLGAVIAAACVLEDDPRFNAGTGANLRLDGRCELDAAIMSAVGETRLYGAVAGITGVRNPTLVARLVAERSPHRLLCGEGATAFARLCGVPLDCPITSRALEKLERRRAELASHPVSKLWAPGRFKGTIGAVARSASGGFATSCSTGGTAVMLPGRIGDSPIAGAGLFAGPYGAIGCTGDGELVQERLIAHRIYLAIEAGRPLAEACEAEIAAFPEGGYLGLIALSREEEYIGATHPMPAARRSCG